MSPFKVATLYDKVYAAPGELVTRINADYAYANGYDFKCFLGKIDTRLDTTWSKIWLIQQELPTCDWLLWVDADALIVNHTFRLNTLTDRASPGQDLLLSTDKCGYCCGVFLMRNSSWSMDLLRTLLFCGPLDPRCWQPGSSRKMDAEQDTFKVLLDHFPWVWAHCAPISDSIVQNPDSAWNPDAFINHYWGNNLGPGYDLICKAAQLYRSEGYTRQVKRPA